MSNARWGFFGLLKGAVIFLIVLALIYVVLTLTGCSTIANHPMEINCTGKGQITGTGYAGATVALGGHEANTFTLTADCGDGFKYSAGAPKP